MAKIERIVPVGPTVRIELTEVEARGLLTLLSSGCDWPTVDQLELRDILNKLTAIGVDEWERVGFGWVAELEHIDK